MGTIATAGANTATYTAPASAPGTNPVTIHATAGTQSASAAVTIVSNAPVSVSVSPTSAAVAPGQRASFTASVTGTSNPAITWTVNNVSNGNSSLGQVCAAASNPCAPPVGNETTVDYLAPQTQPQPNSVTLTATSQAAPAQSGSALITIAPVAQPGVSIAPFYAFLAPSQQFHFIANVTGVSNSAVTWTIATAVPGQGCSGASCGSIDNSGNYVAPAMAPSPNAITITATSIANPSLAGTATVALTSAPVIETILPSSIVAGPQNSFLLAVQGLNFIATTSSGTSQLLINNSPRTTNCPTPNRCTVTLQPPDVAAAGALSVEIQNPGTPPALSNPVPLVILPGGNFPSTISLTSASAFAFSQDILVPEETTAGATTSPVSVEFIGMATPDGSTCTIQASPLVVTRPASGSATVNICVQGTFLDPTLTYAFTSPQSGGDIGISTASMASLFPNLVELTLTLSSQTAPGVRSLFITTPNGDVAVATGMIEVK
ncbi:MAG: immunoglobulin domain-containing protein [Candidatus Acidiferrales bacterium]